MKIYNEVTTIFNDDTGKWETISEDSYEHKGDISLLQEVDWSDVDLDMFSGDTPIGWTQESLQNLLDLPEGTNIIEYLSSKKKKLPKKVVPELIKEGGGGNWDWLFDPNLDTGGNWWDRLTETLNITPTLDDQMQAWLDEYGDMTIEGTDQFNIEALMENPSLDDATRKEILEGIMGQWTSTENIDWTNIGGIPSWQLANIFQDDELTQRYLMQIMDEFSDEAGGLKYDAAGSGGLNVPTLSMSGTDYVLGESSIGSITELMSGMGDISEWKDLSDADLKAYIYDSLLWEDHQFGEHLSKPGGMPWDAEPIELELAELKETSLWKYMTDLKQGWKSIQDYKSTNVMDYDPSDWAEQIFGIEGQGGALGRIQDLYDKIGLAEGEISGIEDLIGSEEEGTGIYGDINISAELISGIEDIIGNKLAGTGFYGDINLINELIGSDVEGEETGKYADIAIEKERQRLLNSLIGTEGGETGLYGDIARTEQDIIDENAAIELERQKKNVLARESMAGIRDYMSAYTQQGKAHRYGKATGAPVSADPTQGFLSGVYGDVGTYEAGLGRLEKGIGGMERKITDWGTDITGYGADITQHGIDILSSKGLEGGYRSDITQYGLDLAGIMGQIGGYETDILGHVGDIGGYQSQIGGYGIDIARLSGDIADYRGESGIGGEYGWMQDFLYGGAGIADDPYDVLSAYGEGGASVLSDWLG